MASDSDASLLVAWQLKNKHVLVVGGGDVASGRIHHVLVAGAKITVVAPQDGLHPVTKWHIDTTPDRITYYDRVFTPGDLDGKDFVLTAIDDVDVSRDIASRCRTLRLPVNVADDPPSCDFFFGSQIRKGPLQILISTNGRGPKLANIIRRRIEESIPSHAGEAIERVGTLRERLKVRAPGVGGEVGRRRMKWMADLCTAWEMEELASLTDEQMDRMLAEGWERDVVLSPQDLGVQPAAHSDSD
ncbi:siroheme synthase [Dentipellis sp. KUC8613]|nr:siroheme synthase [Dentipellis sp. KUC8613]